MGHQLSGDLYELHIEYVSSTDLSNDLFDSHTANHGGRGIVIRSSHSVGSRVYFILKIGSLPRPCWDLRNVNDDSEALFPSFFNRFRPRVQCDIMVLLVITWFMNCFFQDVNLLGCHDRTLFHSNLKVDIASRIISGHRIVIWESAVGYTDTWSIAECNCGWITPYHY